MNWMTSWWTVSVFGFNLSFPKGYFIVQMMSSGLRSSWMQRFFVWYLWQKWQCGRFFFEYFIFPCHLFNQGTYWSIIRSRNNSSILKLLYQGTPPPTAATLIKTSSRIRRWLSSCIALYPLNLVEILLFSSEKRAKRVQILCKLNLLDDMPKFYIVIFLTIADKTTGCTSNIATNSCWKDLNFKNLKFKVVELLSP